MDYVHLGRSGLRVSRLCLGAMNFGPYTSEPESFRIMDRALELGITFFDTANVYGSGRSEDYIGEWLAGKDREDFVVASKVFFALSGRQQVGLSRKIVMAEVEGRR